MKYYGIDIGGSAIKTCIIDAQANMENFKSYDVPASFEQLISLIETEVEVARTQYEISGVVISTPGAVDSREGVIYGSSAIPYIHGPNIKEILRKRTDLPVSIENDANCAALAEAQFGEYKDSDSIAFFVLGSGVGGALINDKKVLKGKNLHGGEFGYMIMSGNDDEIVTLSQAASVGGLVINCQSRGLEVSNGKEVFELAENGNLIAKEEISSFYKYLARGIFNIQYAYDPEVVLLAGAISTRVGMIEEIKKEIEKILSIHTIAKVKPIVKIATFENNSNLIGALANHLLEGA